MPRFRVMLRGEGFRNLIDSEEKPFGFFTTRFVDAPSESQARQRAMDALKAEKKFRWMSRPLPSELVVVEEIAQVSFWTRRFCWRPGFTFFLWEMEDNDAEPNAPGNSR